MWAYVSRTLTAGAAPSAADNASAVWSAVTRTLTSGSAPSAADNAAAVLAANIEGTVTLAESLRLHNAVLAGKVSGAGTGTEVFRDINDTKPRITATVDSSGNRTAIVIDDT